MPPANSLIDLRPTVDAPDDDPYLWLEDIDGDTALAWVAQQNAATLARLAGPAFEVDRAAVLANLDRPDNIPHVTRRGGLLYNFWRDAGHKRGLWRRTTMESYRTEAPDWDILLDIDALAAAETEDWVWGGANLLAPANDRAMLRLSRGGSDATVLREFDLQTRQFVAGGFVLPEAKGGAVWLDRDTLLLAAALGDGMATSAGYARTVRLWDRGTDPLEAPVLFEVAPDEMAASVQYDRERDQVLYLAHIGFYDFAFWLGDRSGPLRQVDLPTNVMVVWDRGWMAVRSRQEWTVGGQTHAPDTLLGIGIDAFLDGDRAFTVLFEPAPRRTLQGFFWVAGRLVLKVLDDLRPAYSVADPARGWAAAPLAGLPAIGAVDAWPLDADEIEADGTLLVMTHTPLSAPALSLIEPGQAPIVLKRAPTTFDPGRAVITRHEAVSSDGERIPYVQIGPPGLTGEAPVFMSGYGGFAVPVVPSYNSRTGKLWIERGGTAVMTNLRGGGEFGTWWHDAGRLANKVRSHDDFAAVAADLVSRGVTRPGRIAAEGGSNGGLLIANMLTRYPERFGALFCTIPLIDMRRYHHLLAGASWIAEYGNPDDPAEWAFIKHFSAYHAAEPGRPYPPMMIATTRKDDRVHPGHARKMAAKLQALCYDALFYEPEAGGHGYGSNNAEVASFGSLGVAFLRAAIGWSG